VALRNQGGSHNKDLATAPSKCQAVGSPPDKVGERLWTDNRHIVSLSTKLQAVDVVRI